ncbi:MAG TPA: hypothetical protein VGM43_19075 [Bryobacteraceae bacterium]|jgi:hypothetical protein
MFRLTVGLLAFASLSVAAQNTYVIGGVGSGYWGAQPFTEAAFTLTFTADTSTFVHSTPCCEPVYSTPSGTQALVNVSGFPSATFAGDQAIFVNNATLTAGIWHYNDPEYLTITNTRFATNDLSIPGGGYITDGATYSYATPMLLSTGDSLYFTSVHDAYFYAQPGASNGQPSAVSVAPGSSTMSLNSTQTFSFIVSDTVGASDLGGLNILFQDSPGFPTACWLYYQVSTATMTAYHNGVWSAPAGTQTSATLTGDACTVDPSNAKVTLSGPNLTLTLPITLTSADNNTWPIYLNATNKTNTSSGYVQVGAVTAASSGASGFTLAVSPQDVRGVPLGQSLSYTVNVVPSAGFKQPVTFAATTTARHSGNGAQLAVTFNPSTVTGSGSTTMTVSTSAGNPADVYRVLVTGTSQSLSKFTSTGLIETSNVPPADSISPNTGAGSSQMFTIRMTDRIDIAGMNLLIAPSLSGQNACWIFFDGSAVYLAGDDGATWTRVGMPGSGSASNSQCGVDLTGASYDHGSSSKPDSKALQIPVAFKPSFAGTKSLFVRANNDAGFDTGYQALGGWTVQ